MAKKRKGKTSEILEESEDLVLAELPEIFCGHKQREEKPLEESEQAEKKIPGKYRKFQKIGKE